MAGKRGMKRLLSAAMMSAVAAASMLSGAPAYADNVGTIAGVESRCNASVYPLCLYYNTSMRTAWWATTVSNPNLNRGYVFWAGTGTGAGQRVYYNAAAMSCDLPTNSTCNVYSGINYTGARDYAWGQRSGQLVDTYNRNASVLIAVP